MARREEASDALRRWNVARDEKGALEAFRNRLTLTLFDRPRWWHIESDCWGQFFLYTGAKRPESSLIQQEVRYALERAPGDRLMYYLDCLLRAASENPKDFDLACAGIELALEESPDLDVSLHRKGKRAILYPAGVGLLDSALVDPLLSWLPKDSQALVHLETALRQRLQGVKHYSQCLNELRKALEEHLRLVLENDKSLENQKRDLGRWLKEKLVNVEVRQMFEPLLAYYQRYQNERVKHGSDWAPLEVDFVIYLTASFMKLLLDVERSADSGTGPAETSPQHA